jgi:hypothetical protein
MFAKAGPALAVADGEGDGEAVFMGFAASGDGGSGDAAGLAAATTSEERTSANNSKQPPLWVL